MIEYIQFFPTLRCNRKCEFCFNKEIPLIDDLPEEKIGDFINWLRESKIKSVDILGGEPFLYEHIFSLLEAATSENNINITISTNGTLTFKLQTFLDTFSNGKVKVGISINQTADKPLLEIIRVHRLWIKSVVTKEWRPEHKLIHLSKELGTKYYLIYMDALSYMELKNSISFPEFMKKVHALKNLYPNIEPVFCKGFLGDGNYRCPAGTEKITIMPDGSVYPCYLLARFEEHRLGNIFENSLSEIIENEKLKIFRNFTGNVCDNKLCGFYFQCKGGCIAHSIIHYGTHEHPDPRCKKE